MSGGVDSSVAAVLLKRAGFDVAGVFMKFWAAPSDNPAAQEWNRCCSLESEVRARRVAKILGIPFYVFNFDKEFKKRIVDTFIKEHEAGLTPNPCVICNKEVKFGLLLEKALSLGADFVATGHYARIKKARTFALMKGKDKEKDQSYFLWKLNQEQLSRVIFPVGGYKRAEVEKLAKDFKLPFDNVKKSMEICFVPNTVEDFLKKYIKLKPGKIIDTKNRELGRHEGLPLYTIGQRKGVKLSGGPYYVVRKDIKKNVLVVSGDVKDLLKKEVLVKDVNWIEGKSLRLSISAQIKIRYRAQSLPAKIQKQNKNTYKILFLKPQRAVTPGQSAVFYKGEELLGGGIIT